VRCVQLSAVFRTLARHSAVDLGSVVVKALVERRRIAAHVDEVILGQASPPVPGKTLRVRRPEGRAAQYRFRYHHQRRLWFRTESAASRDAGHSVR
jgi:hypothetical protein